MIEPVFENGLNASKALRMPGSNGSTCRHTNPGLSGRHLSNGATMKIPTFPSSTADNPHCPLIKGCSVDACAGSESNGAFSNALTSILAGRTSFADVFISQP